MITPNNKKWIAWLSIVLVSILISGILAYITALGAIAFFMRWLQFAGFGPFVVYRVLMGVGILYWVYAL